MVACILMSFKMTKTIAIIVANKMRTEINNVSKTFTEFSNMIGSHQPDLNANWTVYAL